MKRFTCILFSVMAFTATCSFAQNRGIINTAESPHVVLRSVDVGDCQWTFGFWGDKFQLCEEVMVPHMGELLQGDVGHAYNNFKIAAGLMEGEHQGMHWHDGDFYKWMEAAMYVYAANGDPAILQELDECIEVIGMAQEDDGYLSTQVTLSEKERWSNRQHHELYNSGHLLTSACIHYRVTGQRNFLDIAIKHADYLYGMFEPQPPELARFGFNQTQITGLVELYRTTRNKEYLHLAEIFINMRGKNRPEPDPTANYRSMGDMVQERTPLRREAEAVGHAVLALYYYAGAADVYAETGEQALLNPLDRIWDNIVNQKMYVTGACGQTHHGASSQTDLVHEAFIDEYMMPNLTAYNETCANICNAMFSYRLLGIHGEAKYADIMELVLYNSALSGISTEGTHYFYTNPLRRTHEHEMDTTDQRTREPYIPCFCCPPNLVRTIAKSSGWAYSLSENGVAVNLYGANALNTQLQDGSKIQLNQETQYPWDGEITITMENCKATPFDMMLRIPGWADDATVLINGEPTNVEIEPGTYAVINRVWKQGDVISLDIPMEVQLLEGHPLIEEVRNQAAIKRGPVVYCIETPDLPEDTGILDVYLSSNVELTSQYRPDFLGGIETISGEVLIRSDVHDGMYRVMNKPEWKSVDMTFVPYFAWSNRGEAEMTVWIPIVWE
jgi:uncharacterized protein